MTSSLMPTELSKLTEICGYVKLCLLWGFFRFYIDNKKSQASVSGKRFSFLN